MSAPLTLYVLHSTRAPEIVADGVTAARWASQYPCHVTVVVDDAAAYADCGADLIVPSAVPATGLLADWRFYEGLQAAIDQGLEFEQSICFRDDALFLQKGLDRWAAETFYRDDVALAATADRHYYADSFLRVADLFSRWRVPHEIWDRAPAGFTAVSQVFCLRATLAKELFHRRLLVPEGFKEWTLPFSCYASWTCQLLMMASRLVGSPDRPQVPFYVNDGWGGMYNAPPYLLHENFLVYWSARHVAGYSEADLRDWCKKRRDA
jgi:hypothetical protein